MKRTVLLLSLTTGACLYAMNPHENCGIFFEIATTQQVPELVVRKLFPQSAPEQIIFMAHALDSRILPENQLLAMRVFLEYNHLRSKRTLSNPILIQQEIDTHRTLIVALATALSIHECPPNTPIKPLYSLFDKHIRRHALHYKLSHKTDWPPDHIEAFLLDVQQAYDAQSP